MADRITQELIQSSNVRQITRQKTIVENSRDIEITTTDAQIAVNIQLLLQLIVSFNCRIRHSLRMNTKRTHNMCPFCIFIKISIRYLALFHNFSLGLFFLP